MIEPTIKSRPVYGKLTVQPGREHLFIADAEGAEAILDLAREAPADFFADVAHHVLSARHRGEIFATRCRR